MLPEVGDPDKPKLVFFFDEAHLLFKDAPKALLEKVEQVVRLIRSKGVGVYFVTQNPLDIPDTVSRQLGNRIQHALRAFSPMEQKAVKAAATTFRANPAFDTEKAIMELGTARRWSRRSTRRGSRPSSSARLVRPPNSRVGPITDAERKAVMRGEPGVPVTMTKRSTAVGLGDLAEEDRRDKVARLPKQKDAKKTSGRRRAQR